MLSGRVGATRGDEGDEFGLRRGGARILARPLPAPTRSVPPPPTSTAADASDMKAAEFRRIRRALGSEDVSASLEAAYITGWRLASEIFSRQWKHVDLAGGWLRLEPGETKTERAGCFR